MNDFDYPTRRFDGGGQPSYSDWPTAQVLPPPPTASAAPPKARLWPAVLIAAVVSALVAAGVSIPLVRGAVEQAENQNGQAVAQSTATDPGTAPRSTGGAEASGQLDARSGALSVEVIAARVLPSVAKVDVGGPIGGSGSAVVYREDGYLVTNSHVVGDANEVRVTFADGQPRSADVVGTASFTDIAVIKVDATGLPAPVFATEPPRVGRLAVAIGSPFGLDATVTSGIVSALDRELAADQVTLSGLIQTDAAINPGNSGGALVDDEGQIIGINTAILSSSRSNSGVGFAIPASIVVPIADKVIAQGDVIPAFLGINGDDVTPEVAESFGTTAGAVAVRVLEGTPAAEAGLQEGDIITGIDDTDIESMIQLSSEIQRRTPGETVTLDIVRDGETMQLEVTLTERPQRP